MVQNAQKIIGLHFFFEPEENGKNYNKTLFYYAMPKILDLDGSLNFCKTVLPHIDQLTGESIRIKNFRSVGLEGKVR